MSWAPRCLFLGLVIGAAACSDMPEGSFGDDAGGSSDGTIQPDGDVDASDVGLDAGSLPDAEAQADASGLDVNGVDAVPDDASPHDAGAPDTSLMDAGTSSASGSFSLLTYNVAGLPGVVSGSDPRVNTPLISPLLNAYSIVLVQEDFNYHEELVSQISHPYQSVHFDPPGLSFGDGLNRFSTYPFTDHQREAWLECNGTFDQGSDCLTDKGFTVARHELSPGAYLHIYNVHMDAGRGTADANARVAQIAQLAAAIAMQPPGSALIVAGDTNLKADDEAVLLNMLAGSSLLDACRELSCPEPELHDRVMYRSSSEIQLAPMNWRLDPSFVDANGEPLSDHDALGVDFAWSFVP